MQFSYRAVNAQGEAVTGLISAENLRQAMRQVERQGLTPVTVEAARKSTQRRERGGRPGSEDLLVAVHQLATLLGSGVGLDEAVTTVAGTADNQQLHRALEEISQRIRAGASFSEALGASGLALPPYFGQLAAAGEMTGRLAESLAEAVSQFEYELEVNKEIRNALTYPTILLVSGAGAVAMIFVLVVPKFASLLEKGKGELPFLARAVLGTGKVLDAYFYPLALGAAALAAFAVVMLRRAEVRQKLLDLCLQLPVLGPWLSEADIGRWASMMATLTANRVELTRALELARGGVGGSRLRANLSQVAKSVRGGSSLADALAESDALSHTGHGLIKAGERSGELPRMLRSLAKLYESSSKQRMKRFMALLEPIAILVIGAVIGLVMAGIITAITSVNDISF